MRLALLVVGTLALAGCLIQPSSGDDTHVPPSGGWGSGWGGGNGTSGFGCRTDGECAMSLVCARNGECLGASAIRVVHVNWTVNDQTASDATCARAPKLDITFSSSSLEDFGFSPVPCDAGRFTVDRMPHRFTTVQLARAGDHGGGARGTFDVAGDANLDLRY